MNHKKEVSAGGIVFKKNSNGSVVWLVTQHSKHKHWGFPKGLIGDTHQNEEALSAALREVQEEGGVTAKIILPSPVQVRYMFRFDNILVDKTVHFFLMEYVSGDPNDHDWEVLEAKFVTEEELLNTLSFPTEKKAFTEILSQYHRLQK